MGDLKILLYHSVGEIHPDDTLGIRVTEAAFSRQMEILRDEGYKVIPLDEAIDSLSRGAGLPEDACVITFDDGYRDNIISALPVLKEFRFLATFFITVDNIGKVKTSPKRAWQSWKFMGPRDVEALVECGHTIGSHALKHIRLSGAGQGERERELASSKEALESISGRAVDIFSYPYGDFDDSLANLARETGYKAACATIDGSNKYGDDLFKLKRIEIKNGDRDEAFRSRLSRG